MIKGEVKMRNLNKFITGTNYREYVTDGNVAIVEYENVIVKVVRYSVNEYEVTFKRNDRTYSYKCQSQKEVIESIENDIAYHDSEVNNVKQKFVNQQDNVTWVFLEDGLTTVGSYINSFGEQKIDIKKHENEKDFKSHLNTIKRSKHFVKVGSA